MLLKRSVLTTCFFNKTQFSSSWAMLVTAHSINLSEYFPHVVFFHPLPDLLIGKNARSRLFLGQSCIKPSAESVVLSLKSLYLQWTCYTSILRNVFLKWNSKFVWICDSSWLSDKHNFFSLIPSSLSMSLLFVTELENRCGSINTSQWTVLCEGSSDPTWGWTTWHETKAVRCRHQT